MTRSELVRRLAVRQPELTLKDIEMTIGVILDEISHTLGNHGRAKIRGFGSFAINLRPARLGRNPKTGVSVEIPAKFVPHFKPGKELRERVDR